jgi:hypothetical protein
VSLWAEDEMLDGCPCLHEPCRHVQTYDSTVPYQDDYLYMSGDPVGRARLVGIERTVMIEAVSDHFPLIVEVDLWPYVPEPLPR